MIDTHAHLNFPQFEGKIDEIVAESKKAGLLGIIVASASMATSRKSVELAKKYPSYLFASVGIHPQKTDPENKTPIEKQLLDLDKLIEENRQFVKAIGETGLDFSPPPPASAIASLDGPEEGERSVKEQEKLFLGQINLAKKYNLPIIIHARESMDEVINILSSISETIVSGTFHCYSGGRKRITKILNLPGIWYFGFDGNFTYEEGLQNILKLIPLDRILLETDSPFLAPVPHRGETCFPYYIPLIQAKVNEVLGQDLTKKVRKNSRTLFRI